MKTLVMATALAALSALPALAQEAVTYPYDGSYDDAVFAVENAIVDKGLVIDYVSHVGDMLNRTGGDVGSNVEIFKNAQIFLFCSAVVSRQVMEADPMNVVYCPYSVFVAETKDGVTVGHHSYPAGPMQAVQTLLSEIATDATGK